MNIILCINYNILVANNRKNTKLALKIKGDLLAHLTIKLEWDPVGFSWSKWF
jgi:hypothetical protein